VLFDLDGRRHATGRVAYTTHSGEGVTQRPAEWAEAAVGALAIVARAAVGGHVQGIGLSGQIGTHVLLDATGEPLHDAITWQDGRSASVVAEVDEAVDADWLARELDTRLPPGPAWPLARTLWLSRALPAHFARARWIAQPKDLLARTLTGELVSDPSSWRGLARPDGSILGAALDRLGLPDLVPPLLAPTRRAGGLLPAIAERTGLAPGIPVFTGLNDLNASLLGTGVVTEGRAFDVAGTSEHLGVTVRRPLVPAGLNGVPLHGSDTRVHTVYGVTSNGGSVTEWALAAFGVDDEQVLADLVGSTAPGARGLLFLPYLRGERAPVWDAAVRGAFVNLDQSHGTAELVRACLEGVALNLRQIRDRLVEGGVTGDPTILATGGPTRMDAWNRIKADVLQQPIRLQTETDSAALGAAMIAAIGSGAHASSPDAAAAMVHEAETIEPDAARAGVYDDAFGRFLELYPALSGLGRPAS